MQRVLQRGGSRGLGRAALARLSSGGGAPPEAGAGTSAGAAKPARMVPPQPAPRDFEEETLREVQEKIDAKAKLDSTPVKLAYKEQKALVVRGDLSRSEFEDFSGRYENI